MNSRQCVLLLLVVVGSVSAQTPIVEYRFNETGTTAPSTGTDSTSVTLRNAAGAASDRHTSAGGGVSGLAGDRAFDNTAGSTMASTGGVASHNADDNGVDGLLSFTLQGWLNTTVTADAGNSGRLFDNNDGLGNGFFLGWNAGTLTIQIATSGGVQSFSHTGFDSNGQWIFFAVRYDGVNGFVDFAVGTTTSGVALFGSDPLGPGAINGESQPLSIGNAGAQTRAFQGLLDNMRIFGSTTDSSGVVTLQQLEVIRQSDVANANIPEPAVWSQLILGFSFLAAILWRRNCSGARRVH